MKKVKIYGFTLAEVLITLGIIGIVAAMTIPNLSTHLRGKRLQSQFNKTYSELNQAARLFYADNDMPVRDYKTDNDYSLTGTLTTFMSYFKGSIKNQGDIWKYFDSNNNLKNYNLNGEETTSYPCDATPVITDLNGRLYTMDTVTYYTVSYGPKICVDINGIDKPNKWGVDRFVFVFSDNNAVLPYTGISWCNLTDQQADETTIAKYCNDTLTNPAHTCAYFALQDKSPEGSGSYWYDFLKGKY